MREHVGLNSRDSLTSGPHASALRLKVSNIRLTPAANEYSGLMPLC